MLSPKDSDAGRDWGQEEKGTTEDEVAGWHHRLDGCEFEWTPGVGDGQGGLACCSSWSRKESDTTEWLNWNEGGKRPTVGKLWATDEKNEDNTNRWKGVPCSWTGRTNIVKMRILTHLTMRVSLIAQLLKNLPAMQETLVWFLGCEDLLEKG